MPYFLTTLEIKVLRSVYLTHPLSTRYPYGLRHTRSRRDINTRLCVKGVINSYEPIKIHRLPL